MASSLATVRVTQLIPDGNKLTSPHPSGDKEIIQRKNLSDGFAVGWISVRAALRLESHLVNVIKLAAKGDEFLCRVEEKNLLGYSFAIIKPEYLYPKIV